MSVLSIEVLSIEAQSFAQDVDELPVSGWLPGTTGNCPHPQKDRMVLLMISTDS